MGNCLAPVTAETEAALPDTEEWQVAKKITPSAGSVAKFSLGLPGGFAEEYELLKKIGKGEQATVHKCRSKSTNEEYAVKIIKKKKFLKEGARLQLFLKEVEVLRALQGCSRVVKLVAVMEDDKQLYIVQELCKGSELFKQILKNHAYSEASAARIVKQIFEFVAQIHLKGVAHRDVKPQNFLFKNEDGEEICAVDFGFSDFFQKGEVFQDNLGSPIYVAPEVLWGKGYGREVDVWSAGVVMYLMLCGQPPFKGNSEMDTLDEVMWGELNLSDDPWHTISEEAKDLLRKVLDKSPEARFTASQALSHPWLKEGGASSTPLDYHVVERMQNFSTRCSHAKLLMSMIAGHLQAEEVKDLHDQFELMDSNGDGRVSMKSLERAVSQVRLGPAGERAISEEKLQDVFAQIDKNCSGMFDYSDFVAAVVNWEQLHMQDVKTLRDCARNLFNSIDVDGNGFVDPEDVKLYAGESTEMSEVLAAADKNGKGQVSFPEFWNLVRRVTRRDQDSGLQDVEFSSPSEHWRTKAIET